MELCISLVRGKGRESMDFWLGVKEGDWGGKHLLIDGLGGGGF